MQSSQSAKVSADGTFTPRGPCSGVLQIDHQCHLVLKVALAVTSPFPSLTVHFASQGDLHSTESSGSGGGISSFIHQHLRDAGTAEGKLLT